eukprot:TRINITY_DN8493_c0_g1_i1.p1 TRINITY_DN8493_c0_g1~~TRINITY_DN8493_c0_g1_i1.p1  ORF type:complete len:1558 (+),score=475.55 TRINITY_DN8493_c0_g1_i1:191-4864(+)
MSGGGEGETPAGNDALLTYQQLSRRRIYYNRLVGDDVHTSKTQRAKRAPWSNIVKFLAYALVANYVIIDRTDIRTLYNVNDVLFQTLGESVPWNVLREFDPSPKYFEDIQTMDEALLWISLSVIPLTRVKQPSSYPLSIGGYNRVVPQQGICPNSSSITMTIRRAKTTEDYTLTTTKRFSELYPKAWLVESIPPGATASSEVETTENMSKPYYYRLSTRKFLDDTAEEVRGLDSWDQKFDTEVLEEGDKIYTKFRYTPASYCKSAANKGQCGVGDAGGYIATILLGFGEGDNDLYVALRHPEGVKLEDPQFAVCGDVKATSVLPLADFINSGYLDRDTASIAMEFTVYNANYQTLTYIQAAFTADASGSISDKHIEMQTIVLNWHDSFLTQACQWTYLVATLLYFFAMVSAAWKNYHKAIRDFWYICNFCSILSSLVSLTWWQLYTTSMKEFLTTKDFQNIAHVQQVCWEFKIFARAGAFATLTIWLRLLQFLAASKPRVDLLLRTIGFAFGNMMIYIGYVFVIFWGFTAFAVTMFSAYSTEFSTFFHAFVSCFSLFLGKSAAMNSIKESARFTDLFFIAFMIIFFLISLQMFNAVINYAYNRVSEDMEPDFEKERSEAKRKAMRKKLQPQKSLYAQVCEGFSRLVRGQAADDKSASKLGGDAAAAKKSADLINLEGLDEAIREKVAAFVNKEVMRKSSEGGVWKFCFVLFAAAYIAFLALNLRVTANSRLQQATKDAFEGVQVSYEGITGADETVRLRQVNTIQEAWQWTLVGLPEVLYGSVMSQDAEEAVKLGFRDENTACVGGRFNCAVAIKDSEGVSKIARITQRMTKTFQNYGSFFDLTDEAEAPEDHRRFVGGTQDGVPLSELLVPLRRSGTMVFAREEPNTAVENTSAVAENPLVKPMDFCKREAEGGGYMGRGGYVCLMDAKRNDFKRQLGEMISRNFFSLRTQSLVLEIVLYNGNLNHIIMVTVTFEAQPSGMLTSQLYQESLVLLDLKDIQTNLPEILSRVTPGVIYLVFVVMFFFKLVGDLQSECYRQRINEGKPWFATTMQFFSTDVFNVLELFSVAISVVSFVIFLRWVWLERNLSDHLQGNYSDLVSFVGELAVSAKLYTRLSALNMLIIFVRPLKFARDSPRMAKLNQTLSDASPDLSWFVLVLFTAMLAFVMFAYVSFGDKVGSVATIDKSLIYCFYHVLGTFDFWPLWEADPMMAVLFFFPYLILFYCILTSIFFAIIDRNFVVAEPPPFNFRKTFKPLFSRICRCVEWDEDYVMEEDPNEKKKSGPPSRRNRVTETARKIEEIVQGADDNDASANSKSKKARSLADVCDVDERLGDVMAWSKEEAKKFVAQMKELLMKKSDPKNVKNEDGFITEISKRWAEAVDEERKAMEDADRQKRYTIQVHERLAVRDQETLAKYILLLQDKIKKRLAEQRALEMEVVHLRHESYSMRFSKDEMKRLDLLGSSAATQIQQAGAAEDKGEATEEGAALEEGEEGDFHDGAESEAGGRGDSSSPAAKAPAQETRSKDPNAPIEALDLARRKGNGTDLITELQRFGEGE